MSVAYNCAVVALYFAICDHAEGPLKHIERALRYRILPLFRLSFIAFVVLLAHWWLFSINPLKCQASAPW